MNWPRTFSRRPALARRQAAFDPSASIEDLREHIKQFWAGFGPVQPGVDVQPVLISAIRGEWVVPESATGRRVILYFHGGGFIAGSPESHRALISRLAHASSARALVPQYRLAPEFPYPAALRDAADAYRWLLTQGITPANIVFAGLAGAVLGLSTLSFYGRPQDRLANIPVGFAIGAICGTMFTTYKAVADPREFYGSENKYDWRPQRVAVASYTFDF